MSPHRRITGRAEVMAHRVAGRVVNLVLNVVDVTAARPGWPASPLAGDAGTAAER